MVFKNKRDIELYLKERLKNATFDVQQKIYDVIDKVLAKWYGEYDPSMYHRTRQLLHSLVKSEIVATDNGYETRVYFDASSMDYSFKFLRGQMYSHNGASGEEVLDAAMHGSHGATGWKIADTTTPVWDTSMNALKSEFRDMMKAELIANGIPVK